MLVKILEFILGFERESARAREGARERGRARESESESESESDSARAGAREAYQERRNQHWLALCRSGRGSAGSAGSAGGHSAARSCATGVPFTPALHDRHIYRAVSYIFPITFTIQDFLGWCKRCVASVASVRVYTCRKDRNESPQYAAPHEPSERERENRRERPGMLLRTSSV